MKDVALQWMRKAEYAIEEAELILGLDRFDYGGACSRAGFAVIFAARAAFEQKRDTHDKRIPESPRDLLVMFDEILKRTPDSKFLLKGLREAIFLQSWADDKNPIITRDHGHKAVKAAKDFLNAIEPHLDREPVTLMTM